MPSQCACCVQRDRREKLNALALEFGIPNPAWLTMAQLTWKIRLAVTGERD